MTLWGIQEIITQDYILFAIFCFSYSKHRLTFISFVGISEYWLIATEPNLSSRQENKAFSQYQQSILSNI